MEMDKLAKVIQGLKCCIMRNPDDKMRCTECPYRFPVEANCLNRLKMDTLEVLTEIDDDAISRSALLAVYDAVHQGPPGMARRLIELAPAIAEDESVTCGPDYCEIDPQEGGESDA